MATFTIVRTASSSQISLLLSQSAASATYTTKAYVDNQISSLIDSAPGALNTLNELAAALGDDANFATTLTNLIAEKITSVPGIINQYAGSSLPSGWLWCDGGDVEVSTYQNLYNALTLNGTVFPYGPNTNANGVIYFKVPNFTGRVPVGKDDSQTEFNVLGETGGDKTVTLTSGQSGVPAHSHASSLTGTTTFAAAGHTHAHVSPLGLNSGQIMSINPGDGQLDVLGSYNIYDIQTSTAIRYEGATGTAAYERWYVTSSGNSANASVGLSNANNTAANAAEAHNNLQPYLTVNYIIKT
jgi:microcystin-dependent protein